MQQRIAAFLFEERGAISIDWVTMTAGGVILAMMTVAAVATFGLDPAIDDAMAEDARAQAGLRSAPGPSDPGESFAPAPPVFDPGGRDPGAISAPAPAIPSISPETGDLTKR